MWSPTNPWKLKSMTSDWTIWGLRLSDCPVESLSGFWADLLLLFGSESTQGSLISECRCHSCQGGHSLSPSSRSQEGTLYSCTVSQGAHRCHLCRSPAGPRYTRHRTCFQWAPRRSLPHTAAYGCEAPSDVARYERSVHVHLSFPSHLLCAVQRPRVPAQPGGELANRWVPHILCSWWEMLGGGGQCHCQPCVSHISRAWWSQQLGSAVPCLHLPLCCVHLTNKEHGQQRHSQDVHYTYTNTTLGQNICRAAAVPALHSSVAE